MLEEWKKELQETEQEKINVKFKIASITPDIHRIQLSDAEEQLPKAVESLTNFTAYTSYWLSEKDVQEDIIKKLKILIAKEDGQLTDEPGEEAVAWFTQPFDSFPHDVRLGIPQQYIR